MNKLFASKEDLIRDYKELQCLTKIANKYGVHRQTIANKFNKLHIVYKSKTYRFSSNENYFNNDNEEVFYWAGFLAADGCLYERKDGFKQLCLKLATKDLPHMQLFKKCIETNAPISLYKNKNSKRNIKWNDTDQYQLRIASSKIFESLKRFNIVPRKTKIYAFPNWIINHPLVNHFMRGYFDGDGCICKSTHLYLSIRGNIPFLIIFKEILEKHCKLNSKVKPKINNGTGNLAFTGRKMICKITNFLYKYSSVFLERKYEIAQLAKDCNIKLKGNL
jgi:hypothetical protein